MDAMSTSNHVGFFHYLIAYCIAYRGVCDVRQAIQMILNQSQDALIWDWNNNLRRLIDGARYYKEAEGIILDDLQMMMVGCRWFYQRRGSDRIEMFDAHPDHRMRKDLESFEVDDISVTKWLRMMGVRK